jgi:hypothetical protein
MKLLLVGERYRLAKNEERWNRWEVAVHNGDKREIERWLDCSLAHSCFKRKCGPDIKKLEAGGLNLAGAWCMNLLPPSLSDDWRVDVAKRVADVFLDWMFAEHLHDTATHVVCIGARVATALFGYEIQHCDRQAVASDNGARIIPMLVFPGMQSPFWNSRQNWERLTIAVEEFLQ